MCPRFFLSASLDPLLLYRLATFYTRHSLVDASLEVYLQLCSCASSCASWLGVAEVEMQLAGGAHAAAAESALIQANLFDKSHPSVWARLAIVSLQSDRVDLAHQALMQALKLKCQEEDLFTRLGDLYRARGFLDLARATLERSISLRDTVAARLTLAAVCREQQRFEATQEHLERAKELVAPEGTKEERERVRQQWNELQSLLGRELEPPTEEQPEEQAQKVQLQIDHRQQEQEPDQSQESAGNIVVEAHTF